ncbi:calcium-binding protein [Streptomyces sp. enrichment culture]|uniref:calcium-binding protein n=1 Tax=Streptomyces sp. enrichment culture TaxID=1795815 RepID=UPI003F57FB3B
MRKRATLGVLTGALALSTLAVPAAQADGGYGDTRITKVVVDGDNKVVVGTGEKRFTVSVTVTDDSGFDSGDMEALDLYGPDSGWFHADHTSCRRVDDTTATCAGGFVVNPRTDYPDRLNDDNAGTYRVDAWINASDKDWVWKESAGTFELQRHTRLTVNASPEPVRKGRTITVTGRLTRVSWETLTYGGYGGQYVKLQYRKKGTTAFRTLKTVKSTSSGSVSATTTAGYDGEYRFVYAGSPAGAAATSAADAVDVR